MRNLMKRLVSSFLSLVAFTIILGLIYPLIVFCFGKIIFPGQACGSLVYHEGKLIGSHLIGQNFSSARYFHPRASYAGKEGYDGVDSNASNLAPSSSALKQSIEKIAAEYRQTNGLSAEEPLPVDAVTASASGLDPHISLENAKLQMPRIAKERMLSEYAILQLIEKHLEKPLFGWLGQKRVNVLMLNLALEELSSEKK
jgi:K+-transporting ATPase ATPase C chain